LFDEEAVPVADDGLDWLPLRRRLGVSAFGTNAFRARSAGQPVVEDHVESPGQEELYLVVRGRAQFRVDDEEIEVGVGAAVFVPDPESRRGAVALEDETVVMAVGGWAGRAYRSLPWEPIYLARPHMRRGDWEAAAKTLRGEAGEHLDTGVVRFRLACCYAQAGDLDLAREELRRAVEASPSISERAASDELLAPLRESGDWPL